MSATASAPPSRAAGVARRSFAPTGSRSPGSTFSLANLAAIVLVPSAETVPFHFVWVSLTLVYGIRLWRLGTTSACPRLRHARHRACRCAWALHDTEAGWDELTEVPLMAAMFVTVMWHVHRRQTALEEVERLAEIEHRVLERRAKPRSRRLPRAQDSDHRRPRTRRADPPDRERAGRGRRGHHPRRARPALPDRRALADPGGCGAPRVPPPWADRPRAAHRRPGAALGRHRAASLGGARADRGRAVRRRGAAPVEHGRADRERRQVHGRGRPDRHRRPERRLDGRDRGVRHRATASRRTSVGRIFDRFSRVDEGRPRGTGGTGLGLAIVKAIAEAHGGSVVVRSELGTGTTFSLSIPGLERLPTVSARKPETGFPHRGLSLNRVSHSASRMTVCHQTVIWRPNPSELETFGKDSLPCVPTETPSWSPEWNGALEPHTFRSAATASGPRSSPLALGGVAGPRRVRRARAAGARAPRSGCAGRGSVLSTPSRPHSSTPWSPT